jgi:hypothetical protein
MTTDTTVSAGSRPTPPSVPQGPLYNPATGFFNIRRLQYEIFIRGWTSTDEFARDCDCGRTSVFKAVAGKAVRNRIARAILEALHKREPRPTLLE